MATGTPETPVAASRKLGRTVYADDELAGMMETVFLADRIVKLLNDDDAKS